MNAGDYYEKKRERASHLADELRQAELFHTDLVTRMRTESDPKRRVCGITELEAARQKIVQIKQQLEQARYVGD